MPFDVKDLSAEQLNALADAVAMKLAARPRRRPPKRSDWVKVFEELREAGGHAWDQIDDPARFLDECAGS